ncbi:MAG: ABC transporter permease [Clostridia bacterium]|nr:ABC transporter permease [Clostridia bacterium]MBQ5649314.1 ABC transporter permease [Clostridia bacterium]MBQ5808694.1 ABC transporter permease [Clostridia bacterium]
MVKYALQRTALMLFTLFIITLMCFVLIRMLPLAPLPIGDPHTAVIEARREALGYNKPYLVQFGIFLRDVFTKWDWGICDSAKYYGKDVAQLFTSKLPASMIVNLYSIIFSIPIGIALGIFAALKKNTWIDHTISTLVMVCISVPSFVYAFLIQYILCFKLNLFPLVMKGGTDWFSWPMFVSMMPAVLSLAFGTIAGFTRTTRAELTEVLTSEFMLLARTKGLTKRQATVRHAMKNCMVVVLPSIFGSFIGILSGSLIIEKIFSIPGVGELYLYSINALDYPLFILLTVFYTAIGLAAGIVVDVSYGFIDPRIRMGSKK